MSQESQKPWSSTAHVACQKRVAMRWPSVIPARSGITATAWTLPVRCLGSSRCAKTLAKTAPLANQHSVGVLTLTVCWKFVHTGYVSLGELLRGVSPRSGMFAPERAVAMSFSTLMLMECIFQCDFVFSLKSTGEQIQ